MGNHLLREHAPISDIAWRLIDEEARDRLRPALAARRLVDFSGPHGWEHSATSLGRVQPLSDVPREGVEAARRQVLPVVELRAPFTVSLDELRAADRGAEDADFDALDDAAHRIAVAENRAVFHGWGVAAIAGIAESSSHDAIPLGDDCSRYGLALGPQAHTNVLETSEHGGYPLLEHLRKILGGPLVWSPGVEGAVLVSMRGGDFLFESGEDLSVGYDHHDGEAVHLYIEESFSFRSVSPEAAVSLTP
jgi:uncharacterized linocin/CFP29 family protein